MDPVYIPKYEERVALTHDYHEGGTGFGYSKGREGWIITNEPGLIVVGLDKCPGVPGGGRAPRIAFKAYDSSRASRDGMLKEFSRHFGPAPSPMNPAPVEPECDCSQCVTEPPATLVCPECGNCDPSKFELIYTADITKGCHSIDGSKVVTRDPSQVGNIRDKHFKCLAFNLIGDGTGDRLQCGVLIPASHVALEV